MMAFGNNIIRSGGNGVDHVEAFLLQRRFVMPAVIRA